MRTMGDFMRRAERAHALVPRSAEGASRRTLQRGTQRQLEHSLRQGMRVSPIHASVALAAYSSFGALDVGLCILMQPRSGCANPISRPSGLLDLSRPGDPVCRQILERAGYFNANDGGGGRLRSAQWQHDHIFAAARPECRGTRRLLQRGYGRARRFDLSRPRDRNLSLQFLALRDVGRAGRREDLRALTGPDRAVAGAPCSDVPWRRCGLRDIEIAQIAMGG